ncbi:hypothetical protein DH2020_004491 [Rehmannia glutinosa]|uniref:EF-hand domain-containing protein n=1 Tax=Rehmannia glutinosa TaxID=99300 RepID=A0ABR0XPJ1_REHGL
MKDPSHGFRAASEEEKNSAKAFFKKLDANGDGKVSLVEFKASTSSWLSDDKLFKQLDSNGDGTLDFYEALSLYYMEKKVRIPKCDGCRDLLVGPYFSCLICQAYVPNTCDLCCGCYHGGKFKHQHASCNFLDHHALLMLFRDRTTDAHKIQEKQEMEELRGIAKSHYRAGSPEVQALAHKFFKSLDTDGDGRVDLPEFLSFMRQEGYAQMRNPYFFKELDRDGNGTLDFWEVMTLYYIIKSGRPFCDWCGNFIPGIFFSCVECFKRPESSFSLCRDCYRSEKCSHNHYGKTQFLDNYTLLEAQKDSALAQATGVNQTKTRTTGSTSTRSAIPHNAIVPASNGNLYINNTGPTYHTYVVNPPSPRPNYSTAIVPASKMNKWRVAFRAFEIGLGIGSISTTLCSIL